MTEPVPAPAERLCPVDGLPIPPSRGTKPRKYCSTRCLVRAQRLRNKGRLNGVVADTGEARRRGREHTCPVCGRTVWVRPSEEAKWRTCSTECGAERRRDRSWPWNPLQQRLAERMRADRLTVKDVASATGLARATFRLWQQEHGRYLTSASLERVAAFLGLPYEMALAEAGGTTGEQEMARTGRLNIATARPAPGTPKFRRARRQQGRTTRGRPHTPEHAARIRASLLASERAREAHWRSGAALGAFQRSPAGAACQRLWQRLRWHPEPSRGELREWASEVGDRIGMPDGDVLAAWEPHLRRRGLWGSGPHPEERRHAIVASVLAKWPARTHGAWPLIAWWVEQASDGGDSIDGPGLAAWWAMHRPRCTKAAMMDASNPWVEAARQLPSITRDQALTIARAAKRDGERAYPAALAPHLPHRVAVRKH